jgi:NADPH-dependent curcumin reductase CurA
VLAGLEQLLVSWLVSNARWLKCETSSILKSFCGRVTGHFGAGKVFATAGSDEKVKFIEDLTGGVAHAFNYRTQNFEDEIKKVDKDGVDVIIDFVGPNYWNQVSTLGRLRKACTE